MPLVTFQSRVETYLCTLDKSEFISNKKYDTCKYWTCTDFYETFTSLMENFYAQFEDSAYQPIVWIHMGTKGSPLIHVAELRKGFYVKP